MTIPSIPSVPKIGRRGVGVAGSGTFNPGSVSGLALWFKADAGTSTTTNGAAISQWNDQSGNARHVAQATGANQPTYQENVVNGRPVVRFDGTNDYLEATGFTLTQPNTMFVVAKPANVASNGKNVVDGVTTRNAVTIGTTPKIGLNAGSDVNSTLDWTVAFQLVTAVFNGASSLVRRNGVASAAVNPGTASLAGIRIGTFNGSLAMWNGDVAEVLVYNAALSTVDRDAVESHLTSKYAIA